MEMADNRVRAGKVENETGKNPKSQSNENVMAWTGARKVLRVWGKIFLFDDQFVLLVSKRVRAVCVDMIVVMYFRRDFKDTTNARHSRTLTRRLVFSARTRRRAHCAVPIATARRVVGCSRCLTDNADNDLSR